MRTKHWPEPTPEDQNQAKDITNSYSLLNKSLSFNSVALVRKSKLPNPPAKNGGRGGEREIKLKEKERKMQSLMNIQMRAQHHLLPLKPNGKKTEPPVNNIQEI